MGPARNSLLAECLDTLYIEEDGDEKLDSIAVIRFSFKYPRDAISGESFWNLLKEGRYTSADFPKDRVNADAFYHPDYRRHDAVSWSSECSSHCL